MKFTEQEIYALKLFTERLTQDPRPLDDQPFTASGKFLWCEDWEIIEILKYIFNGRDFYYQDPPPRRLKDNPLWSRDDIAYKAEKLMIELENAENIINHFRTRRLCARA